MLLFLMTTIYTYAQSIDFGIRGDIASAWLLNGNVFSGKGDQGYRISASGAYGIHGAVNFSHGYGLQLEIIKGNIHQGYSGSFSNGYSFTTAGGITAYKGGSFSAVTDISLIKIPILFRHERELSGKYWEAGLGYEVITGGTYTATYTNPPQAIGSDITGQLPKGNFIAIIGTGWNKRFNRESNFYFNMGFRLEYGLFDLMGVDGHGQNLTGPKSVILYEQPNPYYKTYHSTHSLELSFNVGLFYRFYPKAMLHKRVVDF